ncbi:MAG: NAD(P)-dependent oxidoreductase [Myxococcota bacterium]
MTWLVTGSTGFVGRATVARLVAQGETVLAATRDPSRAPPGARAVAWTAGEALPLAGVDVVVHAAATRPARYDDPAEAERCLAVNATATGALVTAAAAAGVGRFVYLSAGNAYAPLDRPAREDDPIDPTGRATYYLGSKICGEWWVRAARGLTTAVLRPGAIYGPGMPPGMVPTFRQRLAAGDVVVVADGGRYRADLVYVDDVVDATLAAARGGGSGVWNVGGGRTWTSLEIATGLARALGRPESLIHVDPPTGAAPGFTALDVSRARAELGYTPRDLEVGLAAYVREA